MNPRVLYPMLLALVVATSALGAEIRVRIEASPLDSVTLMEKLNENGGKYNLQYRFAETDFQFRIAVASEGFGAADIFTGQGADASAAKLTPDCRLLFIVTRSGRTTRGGALNAVSKEINKKMAAYLKAKGTLQ